MLVRYRFALEAHHRRQIEDELEKIAACVGETVGEGLALEPHNLGVQLQLARGLPLAECELDRFLVVPFRVPGEYQLVGG